MITVELTEEEARLLNDTLVEYVKQGRSIGSWPRSWAIEMDAIEGIQRKVKERIESVTGEASNDPQ